LRPTIARRKLLKALMNACNAMEVALAFGNDAQIEVHLEKMRRLLRELDAS
jgi:hypothetical protein